MYAQWEKFTELALIGFDLRSLQVILLRIPLRKWDKVGQMDLWSALVLNY